MKRTLGAALAALALFAAACGDDDDDAGVSGTEPAVAADGTGGAAATSPVTIEHRYGTTVIEDTPERVVTLGLQWTDVLLALDVQPVAYLADQLADEGGLFPWQTGLLDDSTALVAATATEIPYEQIAAQRPDLILVTYYAEDAEVYDRLAEIAPTIGLLGERQVDRWQDLIEVAGRIFGMPDEAAAAIAEVDDLVAATAAELPGLEGRTFAMANYVPGDQIYVVADPEDGSSVFFQQLGMTLDPDVLAAADGVSGRAEFSFEQVGLLDGDLLVMFTNGEDPSTLVGYDQLEVVQRGAVAVLDYADVVALNTPTPLSIPYVLDIVRPQLEIAAGAS
jgi:iron complex transport system substrate-binding protein